MIRLITLVAFALSAIDAAKSKPVSLVNPGLVKGCVQLLETGIQKPCESALVNDGFVYAHKRCDKRKKEGFSKCSWEKAYPNAGGPPALCPKGAPRLKVFCAPEMTFTTDNECVELNKFNKKCAKHLKRTGFVGGNEKCSQMNMNGKCPPRVQQKVSRKCPAQIFEMFCKVPAIIEAQGGLSTCPDGYEHILNEDKCKDYGEKQGYDWQGARCFPETTAGFKGCFKIKMRVFDDKLYFATCAGSTTDSTVMGICQLPTDSNECTCHACGSPVITSSCGPVLASPPIIDVCNENSGNPTDGCYSSSATLKCDCATLKYRLAERNGGERDSEEVKLGVASLSSMSSSEIQEERNGGEGDSEIQEDDEQDNAETNNYWELAQHNY